MTFPDFNFTRSGQAAEAADAFGWGGGLCCVFLRGHPESHSSSFLKFRSFEFFRLVHQTTSHVITPPTLFFSPLLFGPHQRPFSPCGAVRLQPLHHSPPAALLHPPQPPICCPRQSKRAAPRLSPDLSRPLIALSLLQVVISYTKASCSADTSLGAATAACIWRTACATSML